MSKIEKPTFLHIIIMLDKLNSAKKQYDQTSDEKTRQDADRTFADCYNWFTQRDISINYDPALQRWFLQDAPNLHVIA